MMDIKEVQSAKLRLQDQISNLLTKFSEEMGLLVVAAHIDDLIIMGDAKPHYLVGLEAKP